MQSENLFRRYQQLQQYVGWSDRDVERIQSVSKVLLPHLGPLIDDFYAEIERHDETRKVITGGQAQIERLKGTLRNWLAELLAGRYDAQYAQRRWQVGYRHVEIGLDQVFTNVALSRIRVNLIQLLRYNWRAEPDALAATIESLNKLLDLDLAIIEDAYQAEYVDRRQRIERLATMGKVAAGIAHELRNPLNAMKTSVYYLQHAKQASAQKTAEHLARIERQVDVADRVITVLSDFARLPIPKLRPIRLESCIADAVANNPVGSGIEVAIEHPPALQAVLADETQLGIVLGNLVRNARDAMPDGGKLSLTSRQAGDIIELDVVDTGVGIPAEILGRIMEPLFSTKARGIGLGLAISRDILDKHGGGLRVESAVGIGTTFTVWLAKAPD